MAFKKYIYGGRNPNAKVSINAEGILSFNSAAMRQFGIPIYKSCTLYYDEETQTVGIKLSNRKEDIKMTHCNNGRITVRLSGFLRTFNLSINKLQQFPIIEKDGMLQIPLKEN